MPRTIETTVFQFSELSDSAKETARNWWRELEAQDFDAEFVIDDAQHMAAILGIEFDGQPVKLMGGGTRTKPTVYWSGFGSQGDGACFEGYYSYAKGAAAKIRKEAPEDKELHRIADALQECQRKSFYRLRARCKHSGHYYHSGCMSVDVTDFDYPYRDIENGDDLIQALRDFADWIYAQLEREYEYRMSDECVDESITINEYEFDASGARA